MFVQALRRASFRPGTETRAKLARKAGISSTTLYRWMNGGSIPAAKAGEVAARLGILCRLRKSIGRRGSPRELSRIISAYRRTDGATRADLLNRCALYLQDRLDREGVDCGVMVMPRSTPRAMLEAGNLQPGVRFLVELLPGEGAITYRLSAGPRNNEVLAGLGSVSLLGVEACVEFVKRGPARMKSDTPRTLQPQRQLNQLY